MVDSKDQVNPTTMSSHHNVLQPLNQEPNCQILAESRKLVLRCGAGVAITLTTWYIDFVNWFFWKHMEDFGSMG